MLRLGAMVMGLPDSRVDQMLSLVGLDHVEAKRRVGNYSLGRGKIVAQGASMQGGEGSWSANCG